VAIPYKDPHKNILFWLRAAVQYFSECISVHPVFYDIGAYEGFFSKQLSSECAAVLAFEPDNDSFDMLKKELAQCSCCQLYPFALGDRRTQVPFYRYNDGTFNSIYPRGKNMMRHYQLTQDSVQQVDMYPLDDLIEHFPHPHIVKIDTEGADLFVLRGAVNTLSKGETIVVVEYSVENAQGACYQREDILELLKSLSFTVFGLRRNKDTTLYQDITFTHDRSIWNLVSVPTNICKDFLQYSQNKGC